MAVEYHSIDGRDRLDGRERRPQRAASKRAGAHRMASQRATAARHSQITHLRTVPAVPDDPDARARRRRVRRSVYPVVGTRAARIALSIWPTEIDLQYLLFRLSFSSQVVSTSLSSYPACSSEPWSVASPILRSGAARPDTCSYGPLFVFHVHVDEHVIMYSTPPWTLSSNSAANGGRGGRPRAPRAARPSQA